MLMIKVDKRDFRTKLMFHGFVSYDRLIFKSDEIILFC